MSRKNCACSTAFEYVHGKAISTALDSVPSLELCDVYDFRYDIAQPFAPNNEMAYSVFVLPRRRHLNQT